MVYKHSATTMMTTTIEGEGTQTFDAERYVRENSFELSVTDYGKAGALLRCIDDRASDSDDCERPVSIPGGGLGLVMDVLGAFTLLKRKGTHATLAPEEAIAAVERAIGCVLFHTDEKSVTNRGVACGGCGHCNGALTDPVKYLLSETDANFFLERGVADIKERLKSRGLKPAVYHGAHAAKAVITIEGTDIGLPSIGKSGEHVYVYHKDFHEKLLALIAHEIAPLLSAHTKGVSEKELVSALIESARVRLSVTVEKLAKQLPKFVVRKQPSLTVSVAQ